MADRSNVDASYLENSASNGESIALRENELFKIAYDLKLNANILFMYPFK